MLYYVTIIFALITIPYWFISLTLIFKNKFNNKWIHFLLKDHAFNLITSNKYTFKTYIKIKITLLIQLTSYIVILIFFITILKSSNKYAVSMKCSAIVVSLFLISNIGNNLIIKYLENKDEIL